MELLRLKKWTSGAIWLNRQGAGAGDGGGKEGVENCVRWVWLLAVAMKVHTASVSNMEYLVEGKGGMVSPGAN